MNALSTFAAAGTDPFTALGINWQMLIFQAVAFLVLVWILTKWVFPPLLKAVDDRQKTIEDSTKAAADAEAKAKEAEANIEKLLAEARKDAANIVTTAHDEATAKINQARDKAKAEAEHLIKNAHEQLEKDVIAARKTLQRDTIHLIAEATEKVVGKAVTKPVDEKLIKQSLEEVSK